MNRNYRRDELAGVYRAARVGLVTPLRDGMNLVAKEYVAAQDPDDPGVLILSRFAGAARQMNEAVIVNPFSREELAEASSSRLSMSLSERRARYESLMAGIRRIERQGLARFLRRSPEGLARTLPAADGPLRRGRRPYAGLRRGDRDQRNRRGLTAQAHPVSRRDRPNGGDSRLDFKAS